MDRVFAFVRGMWEFRQRFSSFYSSLPLARAYDAGRGFANGMTLGRCRTFAKTSRWIKPRQ